MKNDICVSVIVPVYNRLSWCQTSLPVLRAQTLENIEFILIDDGSTDGSYEWLVENTSGDARFTILRQEQNAGPSAARNRALPLVRGKYIGFFDIDDTIPENYFADLYNAAEANQADIVFTTFNDLIHPNTGLITDTAAKIATLRNGAVWDKLFLTQMVRDNQIEFPTGLYCADNVFVYKAFYYAARIFVCNSPSYSYVLQSDSIGLDAKKKPKRKRDIITIVGMLRDFAVSKNLGSAAMRESYDFLYRTLCSYGNDKDFMRQFRRATAAFAPSAHHGSKKGSIMLDLKLLKALHIISRGHYQRSVLRRRIMASGLFSPRWYRRHYPDVAQAKVDPLHHYLKYGWAEGRNPSKRFNTNAYLRDNADVAAANICPLIHYIEYGHAEGRKVRHA